MIVLLSTLALWSVPDAESVGIDWRGAEWVGGGSELRADMELPAKVNHAIAYASGVGAMELHINGKKVGDHYMDPGQTATDQRVLYVSFEVTDLLRPGQNAIGARLGNGKFGYLDMYANRTLANDQSGDATRALLLLFVATLDDGSSLTLTTNASGGWMYRAGPIVCDPEIGIEAITSRALLTSCVRSSPEQVYDHMWHGEIFDSRLALPGWDDAPLSSFPSSAQWRPAKRMTPNVGALTPQSMPPIRVVESLAPVATRHLGDSRVVFDFGQNMAGFTSLTFRPPWSAALPSVPSTHERRVVMLKLVHAELADATGAANNFYYPGMEHGLPGGTSATCSMTDWYAHRWYECANQTTAYIFDADAPNAHATPSTLASAISYSPTFTYHGFQVAMLSASLILPNGTHAPLPADLAASFPWGGSVTAHRAHSDLTRLETVRLGSGPSLLGRIFNATIASHTSQLWSIPTDCPQREKRGWMGDAGISSSSLNTFYDSLSFHSNFMRLIADEQRKGCADQPSVYVPHAKFQHGPCVSPDPNVSAKVYYNGSVPDVVPFSTGPYGSNPGTTDWQAAYIMMAHSVLEHNGEAAYPILHELWPSLAALMSYFDRLCDHKTGLLLAGARGDWVPPSGQTTKTPAEVVAAFTHTLCVSHMRDIAAALGLDDERDQYAKRLASNQKAFDQHFKTSVDATRGESHPQQGIMHTPCCYSSGSQASNLFALRIGAVPPERLNATLAALVISFGDAPHLDVGIFGTTYVFDVLRAHDLDDLGMRVLSQATHPSFGYMIAMGGTTLWESWEGTATREIPEGSSRNHIMFGGGVNRFLAASASGLAQLEGEHGWGAVHVKIAPWVLRQLQEASGERHTSRGILRVAWRYENRTNGSGRLLLNVSVPDGARGVVDVPLLNGASAAEFTSVTGTDGVSVGLACEGEAGGSYRTISCRQVRGSGDGFLRVAVSMGQHAFIAQHGASPTGFERVV